MNKIAIITGVTGQMGSYFSEFLLAKGFTVIGTIRRLSVKNHKNIEQIKNPNFILEPMDLADPNSINALIEKHKPDFFINAAANSFVKSSWDYPEQHMNYNALGVLRQLEAIKRFSPHTRYINFGSSEEHGDVLYSPQNELHPPRSRSIYAASKVAARQIIKVYRESYNLYAIQCWCFNYESPRRGEEFVTRKITKGVASIYNAIKNGQDFEPIELGNLDSKRDWSHAEDFVFGVWLMLNQDKNPKEYVLASGETHSIRELVKTAFRYADIPGTWFGEGLNETFNADSSNRVLVKVNPKFFRPADVQLLQGDASLIRKELGWSPLISFDSLIAEMVKHDLNTFKS